MSTNNGDGVLAGVLLAGELGDEGLSTDNIERGDTKEAVGVKDTGLAEDLGGDGHGRVDGVGDDQDERLGGVGRDGLDEALDDAGVDLKQIVTGHTGLA